MRISYRPDIDGLRALAVLAVVGFHAFPEFFSGGFIGVDVFFVISGFLITSILIQEHQEHAWSLLNFYGRRIVRIFPALVLVLLACLIFGWHVLFADEYKQLGLHIVGGAGFVSNLILLGEVGYFDRASDLKPLLHLWSLGIEEQFYIFWPILIWLMWRLHKKVSYFVVAIGLSSFLYACFIVFFDKAVAFYSPLSRVWELMIGASLVFFRNEKWLNRYSIYLEYPAFIFLFIGFFVLNSKHPFPGGLALIPTLAAACLIASGLQRDGHSLVSALLASRFMVFIGLISYPLYLWHWPLLSFARVLNGAELDLMGRIVLVLLSLILATATYKFIEIPLRKINKSFLIFGLLFAITFVAILGFNVYKRDGLERIRYKRIVKVDSLYADDFVDFEKKGFFSTTKCEQPFIFPEKEVCLQTSERKLANAVVVGDSHAVHAFWGLSVAYAKAGFNLKVLGKGACMPLFDYPKELDFFDCKNHVNQTFQWILENKNIDRVVLVYRGRYISNASELGIDAFERSLKYSIKLLVDSGKKVDYFLPVVEPGFDPRLCASDLPFGRSPPHSCVINQAEDDRKSNLLTRSVFKVLSEFPMVTVINPNTLICKNGECPIFQNEHSLFKDDNHLSYYGSKLIGAGLTIKPL